MWECSCCQWFWCVERCTTHDLKGSKFCPVACINLWFCRQLLSSFFCCSLFFSALLHMVLQKRQVRKPTISAALSLLQNPISKVLSLSILSFSMLTFRLKWLAKQGNLIFLITFITTFVVFSIGLYNFGLLRYYLVTKYWNWNPKTVESKSKLWNKFTLPTYSFISKMSAHSVLFVAKKPINCYW